MSVVSFRQLPPLLCRKHRSGSALLRNWSRCARKLVRLGAGRRPHQLQLLFRQSLRPPVGFHFEPVPARPPLPCHSRRASSPSNQPQVTQHLLRSRRAIDIFRRRTRHIAAAARQETDKRLHARPVVQRSNDAAKPRQKHARLLMDTARLSTLQSRTGVRQTHYFGIRTFTPRSNTKPY